MKKVLFLQINGRSFGGVWLVNKTLCNALLNLNYDVQVCAIRDNHPGNYEETNFKQHTINPKTTWGTVHRRDVVLAFSKGIKFFIKTFKQFFKDYLTLKKDYKNMRKYIEKEKPDYIISSHYQTLPGIPKKYLKKTVHVQHSSFQFMKQDKKNFKTLKQYNKKIYALVWLCKSASELAEKHNFIKNRYIYNPVRVTCNEQADIVQNKRLVVLSRFSSEKRIDLMIKIVDDVFQDLKFKDWTFYIYGKGELNDESKTIIRENNQIFYGGIVSDPKEVLLKSSCSLNTSIFEGFPLSIIESFTCGIPALICDYGESASELVTDGEDGFVVKQNDIEAYKQRLIEIMSNPSLIEKMSKNAKKNSLKFEINTVIKEWEELFSEIDNS